MSTIKVRKYGDSVYVIYTHKGKIFKIFSGAKVEAQFWDTVSPKKKYPYYDIAMSQINSTLRRVMTVSSKIKEGGIDPTAERVRIAFHKEDSDTGPSFQDSCKEYIRIRCVKPSTKRRLAIFHKTFEKFCEWSNYKFNIDTWDKLSYGRFIQYLIIQKNLTDSTIERTVKGVKTLISFAYPAKDLKWMKYNLLEIREEVIALKLYKLKQIIDADLGGYLEKTRDLFIFLATTGMRFCDSQNFEPSLITEEVRLRFRQFDKGNHAYPPLYEASRRVLIKYDGVPPHLSNQKFNAYVKELFEELKLDRPVTTHVIKNNTDFPSIVPLSSVVSSQTARNTFATLCLESGMNLQHVMSMMGHSDYKSMLPYLRNLDNFTNNKALN